MKTRMTVLWMVAAIFCAGVGRSEADVVQLSPDPAEAIAGKDAQSRQVLVFDFSGIANREGVSIEQAILDFAVAGLPTDEPTVFEIFRVTEDQTGGLANASSEDSSIPMDTWSVTPLDLERDQSGLIRFEITDLVRGWVSGRYPNYGLEIRSASVTQEILSSSATGAVLTIHYVN